MSLNARNFLFCSSLNVHLYHVFFVFNKVNLLFFRVAVPLPKTTPNLNRVFLFTFLDTYQEEYDPIACFLYIMCLVEVRLKYDYKVGDINVTDMKNLRFNLLNKLTPMMLKNMLDIIQVSIDFFL